VPPQQVPSTQPLNQPLATIVQHALSLRPDDLSLQEAIRSMEVSATAGSESQTAQ